MVIFQQGFLSWYLAFVNEVVRLACLSHINLMYYCWRPGFTRTTGTEEIFDFPVYPAATHTRLGQIREWLVTPPRVWSIIPTSSVINQTSLLRSQDEHWHQLYCTWQRKENERTPEWCSIAWTANLKLHTDCNLCSYSYHVRLTLTFKKKWKRIKHWLTLTGIFSRDSLAQFCRVG